MRNFHWYFFIYLALWRWEELVAKWCCRRFVNVPLKPNEASHFPETNPTKWGTRKGKTPKAPRSWYTRQMGNFVKNDIWSRREGDFSCVERRRKQLKMKGKCPLATFLYCRLLRREGHVTLLSRIRDVERCWNNFLEMGYKNVRNQFGRNLSIEMDMNTLFSVNPHFERQHHTSQWPEILSLI